MDALAPRLDAGLLQMGLALSNPQREGLLAYLALLVKWNATYNLTAVRDPGEMLVQHVFDSLSVIPALEESTPAVRAAGFRLVDVGSGAGLPGLLLALARPAWQIVSVEAAQKKAAFQRQVAIELGLSNVSVHSARVETLSAGTGDAVISRAFADLGRFVALAGHLAPRLFAMKGLLPVAEIDAVPAPWTVVETLSLHVPELDAQRHLIILEKT